MPTDTKKTVLEEQREQRDALQAEWDKLIDEREEQRQSLEAKEEVSEEERSAETEADVTFRSECERFESEVAAKDERIALLDGKEKRKQTAEASSIGAVSTSEPSTYRKDNAYEQSYYRDLLVTHSELRHLAPRGAGERIERHGREMDEKLPAREAERRRAAESGIDEAEREFRSSFPGLNGSLEASPFESRANPSRETGHGGEFVPPLWLVEDDYIKQLRAGRVISPLCRNLPVPPGTDTIKLPKVKVGTEVAPQLMDNAGVASRDIETTYVEAAVKTLAGQEDVAIQLIEQSPGQVFDRVVQEDLVADHSLKLEQAVSFGQGENYTTLNAGTIKGLFPTANWAAGHRTSTTSTSPQVLNSAFGANWSAIAKERFNTQNVHHVINPAFGAYMMTATDGASETGRMWVESSAIPSFNAAAITPPDNEAEGFFANTPIGPRIYISANIPPILPQGTSTEAASSILFAAEKNAQKLVKSGSELYSYALTAKFDDVWFFESDLRTRVLPEVLSGTLQIRFQVYNYISLLVRYSPSVQFAGGKAWKVAAAFTEAPVEPVFGGYAF